MKLKDILSLCHYKHRDIPCSCGSATKHNSLLQQKWLVIQVA